MKRVCLIVSAWLLTGLAALADEPIIIAHRGASGYLPEHTREAVVMAHAQGADFIEQDVVLSKDHVPVVLHDVQIDTVTDVASVFPDRKRADGRWYAIDFTLDELKTLKVNERVNPRTGKTVFPNRFPAGLGPFRIPTLEEELGLIEGLNRSTGRKAGIYPELKAVAWHREQGVEMTPIVLEVLTRHGYNDRNALCFLQCFEFDELVKAREIHGYRGKLIFLMGGSKGPEGLDLTSSEGLDRIAASVDGIGPALPMVLRQTDNQTFEPTDLIPQAHKRNLKVHPYTIRTDARPASMTDPAEMYRLVLQKAGADGVFTDQPDAGVEAVKAMKTPPHARE